MHGGCSLCKSAAVIAWTIQPPLQQEDMVGLLLLPLPPSLSGSTDILLQGHWQI